MNYLEKYEKWLNSDIVSKELKEELEMLNENEIYETFYKDIEFGTGGIRGVMGAGTNKMNSIMVKKCTKGYANYLLKNYENAKQSGVVIAHDNRKNADKFTLAAAGVLASMGIKSYIFYTLQPTPLLSFAVRYLKCCGGIVITASHNPKEYNGYKIYNQNGCQLVPKYTNLILEEINKIEDELNVECDVNSNLITVLNEDVENAYIKMVINTAIRKNIDKTNFKIVYSPQHGAGYKPVMKVLTLQGYQVYDVKEQAFPSKTFENTESPNPEDKKAYKQAIELATKVNADLVLTTDPDSDRVGSVVFDNNNEPIYLTGNEMGAIILDYILKYKQENNLLNKNYVIYNTIVTSSLGEKIANSYGIKCEQTLTGFKYIGEKIQEAIDNNGAEFLLGYEESYGYLINPEVRDKDGIQSAMLISEIACYYKNQGFTLIDILENIYKKYGFYIDKLHSFYVKGSSGILKISNFMKELRENLFKKIADEEVYVIEDYLTLKKHYKDNTKDFNFEKSDVLRFVFEDGSYFAIRPSGTEPKCKIYFSICAKTKQEVEERYEKISKFILTKAEQYFN